MNILHRCLLIMLMLVLGLPVEACTIRPLTYSAEAIEAWVIDEDTGQPLEGVIVVANWELMGGIHPDIVGSLMLMETTTDAAGRFFFPAWGPKLRPLGKYLHTGDPSLLFFKSGYRFQGQQNSLRAKVDRSSLRRSEWHGKTIAMKKFEGNLEEYADHLGDLDDRLEFFAFRHDDCAWQHIPHMLVAMHLENKRFREQGLRDSSYYPSSIETRERHNKSALAECGSVREFLRSYLP